ncbi:hypothetical protein [Clostridium sardiniense]|uniref:hypothetical protein n=1 Tax=Clostridium sardiniense TaxID=29369 RepID=UPI00195BB436|nr:hypothetical protein [Clostridium sardiniense]MBM7836493.1 hypothetical protein [Clostridium sardiniense]
MEKILLDLVKYVGVPALLLIIIFMCFYKYGDKIIELIKTKGSKNSLEPLIESIKEDSREDKNKLYELIEDGKKREDNLNIKIDETNAINRELAAALNQSTATNKELCDKMNFEIIGIKDDVSDLKNSFTKINDNILEIKIRSEEKK